MFNFNGDKDQDSKRLDTNQHTLKFNIVINCEQLETLTIALLLCFSFDPHYVHTAT